MLLAESQGLDVIRVQCVSPVYRGSQRTICTERCRSPPLIAPRRVASRVPVLLVATPRGAVPAVDVPGVASWETPWGSRCSGLCVPVARYGLLRGVCRVEVGDGFVSLLCPGEPDPSVIRALARAAERIGAEVRVASARLYGSRDVARVADYLERRLASLGRLVVPLPPHGLAHLVMAAIHELVFHRGYEPGVDVVVQPLYDPSLGSRERNLAKNAADYMCAHGDPVACKAAKLYHVPLWTQLLPTHPGLPGLSGLAPAHPETRDRLLSKQCGVR